MTTLVIVDDHPIMLSGVEALLRDSGYEIIGTAANGAEALTRIAETRPEILLMDISMPVCSGLDVLKIIRGRGDDLPVILITAGIDTASREEAVRNQVNGIIMKDTAAASLLDCLSVVRQGRCWIDPSLDSDSLDGTDTSERSAASVLSQRETSVARLVSRGLRNREIAAELGITEGTVKLHLHKVYEKLGIGSRTELMALSLHSP